MGLTLTGGFGLAPYGWMSLQRPWAGDLLADAAFTGTVVSRWSQLRADGLLLGMLRRLYANRRVLRAAQERNARRWPRPGSPSHAAQTLRLPAWLVERVRWIDANIQALGGIR